MAEIVNLVDMLEEAVSTVDATAKALLAMGNGELLDKAVQAKASIEALRDGLRPSTTPERRVSFDILSSGARAEMSGDDVVFFVRGGDEELVSFLDAIGLAALNQARVVKRGLVK